MKAATKVVKVIRGLSRTGDPVPALIYARGERHKTRQFLSLETQRSLGRDLFGYFEAEKLQDLWWIGERLPDGNRGW